MKTHPIPVRPIPYDDESPASLLIRAAEANGHTSVFQLLSQVRAISSKEAWVAYWTDSQRYRQLVHDLGFGVEAASLVWLRAGPTSRSPRLYRGRSMAESLFTTDCTRFCPRCLENAPYWRRQWSILPFPCCVEHNCLLLNRCGACGGALSSGRARLLYCNHCNAHLPSMRGARIKPASQFLLESLCEQVYRDAMTGILGFWEALAKFDCLGDAPLHALDRLNLATSWFSGSTSVVQHIAERLIQEKTVHPRIQMLPFLTGRDELVEFAEQVLEKVPQSNWEYITDKPGPRALTKREVLAVLKISAAELSTLLRKGELVLPTGVGRQPKIPIGYIESFLDQQRSCTNSTTPKVAQSAEAADDGWFDVKKLALRWLVHPEVIRSLISAKWLRGQNRTENQCRKMMVFLDEILAFEERFVLVGTLAREWGVNPTNLGEKLKSLGAEAVGGPGIDRVLTSLFQRADVASVTLEALQSIERYPTRAGRKRAGGLPGEAKADGMALSAVAEMLGINARQVATLLRRGVLRRTEKIRRPTQIDRASYWKLWRTLQRDDLLSIEGAAESLGVGVPLFRSNWIITGIVKVLDLGIWRFVNRGDVEMVKQLRGKYLTATEAGRMLGMHRTHMLNLEKRGLVEPVRLGKNKQLRLYERNAVRDLVRQPQELFVSADKSIQKPQAVPLSKTWDGWLPLPEMEAGSGGAPRLTWESLWTGNLEGGDEAELSMRDAQVDSAANAV